MKKKSYLAVAALVVSGCIAFSFGVTNPVDVQDNNGRAGRTGSPNETTCVNGCHSSFALNDGTGSVTITSPDLVNWQYMPGDTYNINVTVTHVGSPLFGLGVECLTGSTPAQNAGTLLITNTTETTIKTITVNTVSRRNVVHKLNGGVATDTKTFAFKWVAPTSNIGNVTFYAAGNGANGNNQTSGDHIYTTSQVVTPAPGAGVSEIGETVFSLYPNPAHDHFSVNFTGAAGDQVSMSLYSIEGKELAALYSGEGDGLAHTEDIQLPADLPGGVYFVRFVTGATVSTQRIVIR